MRPKTMYRHNHLKGMYLYVNYIMSTEAKGQKVNASWWTRDDATGKLIDMDITQEVFVPNMDDSWSPIEEGRY